MKKILLSVAVLSALSACTNAANPVLLLNNRVLDAECALGDIALTNGSLNLGLSSTYLAGFETESTLEPVDVTAGGDPLAHASNNDFIGQTVHLSYQVNTNGVLTALGGPQQSAVHFVIPAGASREDSFAVMNLLTPDAATLAAGAAPAQIVVSVRVEGTLRGGGLAVSTNTVRYPINVFSAAAPTCPAGTTLTPSDAPCGNLGQDGSGFTCE